MVAATLQFSSIQNTSTQLAETLQKVARSDDLCHVRTNAAQRHIGWSALGWSGLAGLTGLGTVGRDTQPRRNTHGAGGGLGHRRRVLLPAALEVTATAADTHRHRSHTTQQQL
jgi:hypothetical protein